MMKRFDMRALLAICFGLLLTAVAHGQTGPVSVGGMGGYSCGQFIATIGKHPPGMMQTMNTGDGYLVSENAEYQQWLLGFVSGFNYSRAYWQEEQVTGIDLAGLDLWMRNRCNQHPTSDGL
jgi:hypothetical protein